MKKSKDLMEKYCDKEKTFNKKRESGVNYRANKQEIDK